MPSFVDISGKKFGQLRALHVVGVDRFGGKRWRCLCVPCGKKLTTSGHLLRSGQKVNCGCTWGVRHTKHGMAETAEYAAYYGAKRRCRQDPNYKGRIKFKFRSFREFFKGSVDDQVLSTRSTAKGTTVIMLPVTSDGQHERCRITTRELLDKCRK